MVVSVKRRRKKKFSVYLILIAIIVTCFLFSQIDKGCFGCEDSDILHHSKLIRQHYVDLTESIEVEETGLLNHLVAGNVITEREKEDITTEWNKFRQAEILLAIIARKSSADYAIFLQALITTNQKHIYDILHGIEGGPRHSVQLSRVAILV